MQRFAGAGDVPALDHLDEIAQLAQVHVYAPKPYDFPMNVEEYHI
jgi:hypothetical protein